MGELLHWYSEEGTGRVAAPPSALLVVPNVTAHPSRAGAPSSFYSMWHCNYFYTLKGQPMVDRENLH